MYNCFFNLKYTLILFFCLPFNVNLELKICFAFLNFSFTDQKLTFKVTMNMYINVSFFTVLVFTHVLLLSLLNLDKHAN